MFRIIFLLTFTFLFIGCDGLKEAAKNLFDSSERAKYERRFNGADSLMTGWKRGFSAAKKNSLQIPDPFTVSALYSSSSLHALGWALELKKGDLLVVETSIGNPAFKIFLDIMEEGAAESIESVLLVNRYSRVIEKEEIYRLIVQPEIAFKGNFELKIYTQPSLSFPVAGKGNRDIQSFWGAERAGGARTHEGVDIFAPRGNPVLAATDGFITRTGNFGLGGKQVWVRSSTHRTSLYYAHLDSIMTENGQKVKVGDTLGTVGNTGNAEGGTPHLHFGIYTAEGAVDPYPFIRQREKPLPSAPLEKEAGSLKAGSRLRSGPGTGFNILESTAEELPVQIRAKTRHWLQIRIPSGKEGFVSEERIK